MTVCVVGSANLDVVHEVDRLPGPGETVAARAVRRNLGGKGANQAVAALLAGAAVEFVARVGDDAEGRALRTGLAGYGLTVDRVRPVPGARCGTATITVDARGENTIVLDAGANARWEHGLGPDEPAVRAAAILVLQHEVPEAVVQAAVRAADGRIVLNAAPFRPLTDDLLGRCDPLVVNRAELAALVPDADDAGAALDRLIARGARSVVVTLGADGARWAVAGDRGEVAARPARVVDTTGAGDAFVGALVARLAAGSALADAVPWAVVAATLAVERPGTLEACPTAERIDAASG